MLSPDIRNKSAMSILMIPIQHCTGSSTQYSKAKRDTKGIQNGKEEVKPFLFSDDIIICVGIIWHHRLNEHEFEQTLRDSEGKGSLTCCIPRSCKESDKTQQLNNNMWKNPMKSTEEVTKTEFSKGARYNIIVQKSTVFLYNIYKQKTVFLYKIYFYNWQ